MRAFVDRIQTGIATLLLGEDELISVSVPVTWLPAGVREGDVLHADWTRDPDETLTAHDHVQSLLDELGNNP